MNILILDSDPVLAARSLTTVLIKQYIVLLKHTFVCCHNPYKRRNEKNYYAPVQYSVENYMWFSQFLETLTKIIKSNQEVEDYEECLLFDCEGVAFRNRGLCLAPDSKIPFTDLLDLSRLEFINKNYSYSLFPCGYPNWYIDTNVKIYEKYDYKLQKSFKIQNERGRLRYYVAKYFNQWVEIKDVPVEIDELARHFVYQQRKKDKWQRERN